MHPRKDKDRFLLPRVHGVFVKAQYIVSHFYGYNLASTSSVMLQLTVIHI
jgi:hypothetical protein